MSARSSSLSPPPLKRRCLISLPKARTPPQSPSVSTIESPRLKHISEPLSLRIFSWNINGIAPYLDQQTSIKSFFPTEKSSTSKPTPPHAHPSLRACIHRWAFPHIICLQEVKIAPSDTSSQNSVRRVVNAPLADNDPATASHRLYDVHFNLPRDKNNATGFGGKVYGVCTLVRRDIAPATETRLVDWDLEGRVLITELIHHAIVVFNIYAVNGTSNPYRDPSSGKVIGDRHMRKRAFHTELRDECSRYERAGWDVVIAGDLNISQTPLDSYPQLRMGKEHVENREHFRETSMTTKAEGGLGLRDSFRELNGKEKKFSYRPPGRFWGEGMDRVDLCLVSDGVRLKGADILDSVDERGSSDHVPLSVEVEVGGKYDEVKDEGKGGNDEVGEL
ncbi:MAG: hypothetical protein Q9223_001001, partial [Gallowayella weberi]